MAIAERLENSPQLTPTARDMVLKIIGTIFPGKPINVVKEVKGFDDEAKRSTPIIQKMAATGKELSPDQTYIEIATPDSRNAFVYNANTGEITGAMLLE